MNRVLIALLVVPLSAESLAAPPGRQVARQLLRSTPALRSWGVQVRGAAREARALRKLDLSPLSAAGRALADPGLRPDERGRLLEDALGPSLSDTVQQIARSVGAVASVPASLGASAGRALDRRLRPGGKLRDTLTGAWWASYLPDDLQRSGAALDRFLARYRTPEFRAAVDSGLGVLRVAARLELATLSRIGVAVRPGCTPALRRSLQTYLLGVADVAASGLGAGRAAIIARRLQRLAAIGADPSVTTEDRDARLQREAWRLVRIAAQMARRPARIPSRSPAARLELLGRRLQRDLASLTTTSPETRQAVSDLHGDLTATGRLLVGGLRMAGAMRNPSMPAADRARMIKESAEAMGPIFIKLMQTAVNHPSLQSALVGSTGDESSVLEALRSLQDRVSPMPREELRRQIHASLGHLPEQAFVDFATEPLASGSIGQVHRARIRRDGRLVEVVVKVQRPGLERSFDEALRTTRLASQITREALAVFPGDPAVRDSALRIAASLEATIPELVRSFRRELDFTQEAAATRRAAAAFVSSPDVKVPQIIDSHTRGNVITMELLRGERLSSFIDRCLRAEQARGAAVPGGPLLGDPRSAAEAHARDLAMRTYGLAPARVMTTALGDGYQVRMTFAHAVQKAAVIRVQRDGSAWVEGKAPDLSLRALERLRRTMIAAFARQHLIDRNVHADLHEGNLLVLANGRSLGLLDFGSTVEPAKTDYLQVAHLVSGWFLRSYKTMARALVSLNDDGPTLSAAARGAAIARVADGLRRRLPDLRQASVEDLLKAALQVPAESGHPLSSRCYQWIKASISMAGDLDAIERSGLRPMRLADTMGVAGTLIRTRASRQPPARGQGVARPRDGSR